MKFKIGDRVKFIDARDNYIGLQHYIGTIWEVVGVWGHGSEQHPVVQYNNKRRQWYNWRFKKVLSCFCYC